MKKESDKYTNIIWNEPELYNLRLLFFMDMFLLIAAIVMPQYFGVHIGWDITCTRLANILIVFYSFLHIKVLNLFLDISMKSKILFSLLLYLFVAAYTMVFRADINCFMNPFLEILTFFMMMFSFRYVIGCKRAIKTIIACAYFLGVYGVVEFATGRSLYLKFFNTLHATVGVSVRSGYYRVMGPCGHAIGYGLLLILLIAVACIDIDNDDIYIFQRPVLMLLLIANIFFTGSRSSQGIALAELIIIFFASNQNKKRKTGFWIIIILMCGVLFLTIFSGTKIGKYFLLQFAVLFDQVFKTDLSSSLGAATTRLSDSEEYRKFLPYIFKLDWLNPIVGRGVKRSFSTEIYNSAGERAFIASIDNFYICQYVKYAYPGMISYIIFIITSVVTMIRKNRIWNSGTLKVLLIGAVCYFVNLWWVDALQTQKFVYIIIALFFAVEDANEKIDKYIE